MLDIAKGDRVALVSFRVTSSSVACPFVGTVTEAKDEEVLVVFDDGREMWMEKWKLKRIEVQ